VCLIFRLYPGSRSLPFQCVATAPPRRRGRAETYNLRREIPTNTPLGCDNLVSGDRVFAADVMSSQSAAGTANTIDTTLNAILRRLDTIELKMEPLQPL
jgi:hypothetical protein